MHGKYLIIIVVAVSAFGAAIINRPKQFGDLGKSLVGELFDFRHDILDIETINEAEAKKKILIVSGSPERFSEYSSENWKTMRDALIAITAYPREITKPQIRLIKKSLIIQSRIGPKEVIGDGYTKSFLETALDPGDIIVLTLRE
jgi:hypothetical protein